MGLISYPRCYVSVDKSDGVIISKGDQTVQYLYDFHVNRTGNTTNWQFRKQVLQSALRLFGELDQWLLLQARNPRVAGNNAAFIHDTLNFIRTGERQLAIENWIELLDEDDDMSPIPTLGHAKETFALHAGETTIQLLQNWAKQAGGMQDLLCTLHVLFGQARRTLS